jgi:hypothetical protein
MLRLSRTLVTQSVCLIASDIVLLESCNQAYRLYIVLLESCNQAYRLYIVLLESCIRLSRSLITQWRRITHLIEHEYMSSLIHSHANITLTLTTQ